MPYEPPTRLVKTITELLQRLDVTAAELEVQRPLLLQARCYTGQQLADVKLRCLHPRDKDLTELDRTVMLNANVSNIQADYDVLLGLEELVRQRIELLKWVEKPV